MGPIEHGERCSLKLKFSEGTRKLIIMYVLLGKQGYMYYKENEFISVAYSYAHNKPIVCPFMKQNEVYLTRQNLTKSCSWPLDFSYTFVKCLDLSMLKI